MERSLRILDTRARRASNQTRRASVRRPRRSGLVLMDDAGRPASSATSSSRRPCCSRSRRWRPRGRPTRRRAGTASRRGPRARRSPPASSRRARRTWRTGRARSTSRCSRSGSTPTRATRPSSPRFYRKRFRPEFQPAFDAWVATRPRKNPERAAVAVRDAAVQARGHREGRPARGARPPRSPCASGRYIQRADNYALAGVLFAASLFFAGISTRLHAPHAADGRARARLRAVPRQRDLDRDVPGQRVDLATPLSSPCRSWPACGRAGAGRPSSRAPRTPGRCRRRAWWPACGRASASRARA